jgi:hypothetical protein
MRRLVKKAGYEILYHITTWPKLKNIMQSGEIKPQGSSGAGFLFDYEKMIETETDEERKQELKERLEENKRNYEGFVFLTNEFQINYGDIFLEVEMDIDDLYPDLNDGNSIDAEDSLIDYGQCAHKGSIPTSEIVNVHFVSQDRRIVLTKSVYELENKSFTDREEQILINCESWLKENV